jgi:hypothetical protein
MLFNMKTNFSLLFYLKKPKNDTAGPVPIYLRITIAGKRSGPTTARSCDPLQWNSKAGRFISGNIRISEMQK